MQTPLTPDLDPEEDGSTGPLLGMLARGLELWLRQQCQAVQELEITLEGSMLQLLRGHLQAVRLRARRVVFQNLNLEEVDLCSAPIQLGMGALLRGQPLRLDQPFHVRGAVLLTGEGLSRTLTTPDWQELGDRLSQELLGVTPLRSVRLRDDRLILTGHSNLGEEPVHVETRMLLTPAGLQLQPVDGRPPCCLPMDEAIHLERAEVRSEGLELAGEALVRP